MNSRNFDEFFRKATGYNPFPFQRRFAEAASLPQLIDVPTGLGKTAMAVVGWLWRRFGGDEERKAATPRRLVYCLPMRVLVEQTAENAELWLHNVGLLAGTGEFEEQDGKKRLRCYTPDFSDPGKVAVHILMGGENEDDWDLYPEREAIIVGTQDMLLSRAMNRGYAASRSRWPMQFGLLNADCLWIFDEIQLMGSGLATTAQLEAFRRLVPSGDSPQAKDGHGCRSVWMSATMHRDWLKTVDFKDRVKDLPHLELSGDDHKNVEINRRWTAKKLLRKTTAGMDDTPALAAEILDAHKTGTRTIVVVNTVKRACELFEELRDPGGDKKGKNRKGRKQQGLKDAEASAADAKPKSVLLHSRFRPEDRKKHVDQALGEIKQGEPGTIVVSTQVIEAGVDVSSTTLLTELAPWASLVQRFGRCNRRGEANERAAVRWIDVPNNEAAPYDASDLRTARNNLDPLEKEGVGLGQIHAHIKGVSDEDRKAVFKFEHTHVIRRKDLIDLFDTTPDLAGNDIDIDRFIREAEDSDVRVFWRYWERPKGYEPPPEDEPAPCREELCPAPIGSKKTPGFQDFARKHPGKVWRWTFLDEKWEKADAGKIMPGQVYLIHADAGGYSAERGWDPDSEEHVKPIVPPVGRKGEAPDATEADPLSRIAVWQTIAEHGDDICRELDGILAALHTTRDEVEPLHYAARWHDRGKAHNVFQAALPDGAPDAGKVWAKAAGAWKRYGRRYFRHELASALAVLLSLDGLIPAAQRNLIAYLVAAHHGKVRLSIRSLPNETRPRDDGGNPLRDRRFARGVWDRDELPATELGDGVIAPSVALSLEPMELGLCEHEPFAGQPSWAERMIGLRDGIGPFRLAYLEALLRAADQRASKKDT